MKSNSQKRTELVKTKIINSAIDECATRGWSNMTIRSIAESAKINPALLGYYFENKSILSQEVVKSTLTRLNDSRKAAVEVLRKKHGNEIPIEQLIKAYALPFLEINHPLYKEIFAFLSISAHLLGNMSDNLVSYARSLNEDFDGMYLNEIRKSASPIKDEDLYLRFEMMLGALIFTSAWTRGKDAYFSRALVENNELIDRFAQTWGSVFLLP